MDKFSRFIPIILASGVISFVLTPLLRRLAHSVGFVDIPNTRKIHASPVPLLGGVAIYLGMAAAVAISGESTIRELIGVLGGATIMVGFGLWDDRYSLKPAMKLLGQAIAATLLIASGISVSLFPIPALNYAITLLWVLGITNALNLLDNMDGLAAGIAGVASAFFLILAVIEGLGLVASLAAATLGACVAFLYFNFSPASLFMGDAGSMVLGFALAVLGIKLDFKGIPLPVTWAIPVIILGVPIFDTTLVVVSRLRRRRPITMGGKDHTSHRLVELYGMTPTRAVMTLYLVAAALGLLALLFHDASILEAQIGDGLLAVGFAAALIVLEARFRAARAGTAPKDNS
jgi:UDP-GlcNAc:undecaprenyl-phosphate GlcNAc-1-phosphate transferase